MNFHEPSSLRIHVLQGSDKKTIPYKGQSTNHNFQSLRLIQLFFIFHFQHPLILL